MHSAFCLHRKPEPILLLYYSVRLLQLHPHKFQPGMLNYCYGKQTPFISHLPFKMNTTALLQRSVKLLHRHLKQVALNRQLKRWCVSLLKDVHIQNQGHNYRLLPSSSSSPSVEKSGPEGEPESLPLLPLVSGESSASLATYVNVVPAGPGGPGGLGLGHEALRSRTYFEMRVDRSPGRREEKLPAENSHNSNFVVHNKSTQPSTQCLLFVSITL